MKSYKKFTIIAAILLLLIAIIFAIYYFSNEIFKVKKETKLVEMSLPAETQNLIIGLEGVKLQKGKGNDSVLITGWVFKQNVKEKMKDVYMVLKSNKSTLIFELGNADLIRPDVEKYFHLDEGINNHGFEMSFPVSLLIENTYQVGFVIGDNKGKYFTMSSKSVTISDGVVTLTDLKSESNLKSKFNQVSMNLKVPTGKINYNLETISTSGNNLTISGWGFLEGMNSDFLRSFILLKKNETVTVFSMGIQIRKDVTNYFKKSQLNFDSSGFSAQISTENMEKGRYQVGLYIEKGNHTGMSYSDKYVDIDK